MFSTETYILAWVIYLVAAVTLSACIWRVTRNIRTSSGGQILRILVISLLFTPWYLAPDVELLAPSFLLMAFSVIKSQSIAPSFTPIAAMAILLLLVKSMQQLAAYLYSRVE